MKHLYCSIFGHDYRITKRVTYHVKEYSCKHCKQKVTTNGNGKLTPLTPKYQEINALLEKIHYKRAQRRKPILNR
ncbi:MAG: hypothetical protein HRT67_03220 [Flavobacteriaceae bacterium]|nr:hypothetical protein [Flavobacteriaceae bacterium]